MHSKILSAILKYAMHCCSLPHGAIKHPHPYYYFQPLISTTLPSVSIKPRVLDFTYERAHVLFVFPILLTTMIPCSIHIVTNERIPSFAVAGYDPIVYVYPISLIVNRASVNFGVQCFFKMLVHFLRGHA